MAPGSRLAGRLQVAVLAPDGGRRPAGLGDWLAGVAPRTARGEVGIALVSDRRMRTLNRTFRGVDRVTDVLSFPAFAGVSRDSRSTPASARAFGPAFLGDIVIATGVAERQAAEAGHAVGTELRVLALHGLLHLLGFDHETDGGVMARTEQRLRRKGGLPEGLIERVSPKPARNASPAERLRRRPARRPRR